MAISEQEIRKSRKTLLWGFPYTAGTISLFYFFGVIPLTDSISEIIHRAPSVRLGSAAILSPWIILMLTLATVAISLKAIPAPEAWLVFFTRAVETTALLGLFMLMIGVPLATWAQYHFMPEWGYTQCNILKGHPTLWFNDWVRNPEWCVGGKDRDWVAQQAG